MSYENAPGTRLVATHCAICHRPLLDAESVEQGMGPTCRKRHGSEFDAVDEDARKQANKHVYAIACHQDGPGVVSHLRALLELGFPGVVKAIVKSVAKVKLALTDDSHPHGPGRLALKTPYDYHNFQAKLQGIRNVPGRRWDSTGKVNTFPVASKKALWGHLLEWYEGQVGFGPKGPFVVRAEDHSPKA